MYSTFSPLCSNLLKPASPPFSPGFEKNRFVDVWPSAAWLCPSDATILTWFCRAGHDGQDAIQKVRKALFLYGDIVKGEYSTFFLLVKSRQNTLCVCLHTHSVSITAAYPVISGVNYNVVSNRFPLTQKFHIHISLWKMQEKSVGKGWKRARCKV